MTRVRMDAWLRGRGCSRPGRWRRRRDLGRILSNGQAAKAAREVRVADRLRVTNDGGDFEIDVLGLSGIRGPASEAQKLYCETEQSKEMRLKVAAERRAA